MFSKFVTAIIIVSSMSCGRSGEKVNIEEAKMGSDSSAALVGPPSIPTNASSSQVGKALSGFGLDGTQVSPNVQQSIPFQSTCPQCANYVPPSQVIQNVAQSYPNQKSDDGGEWRYVEQRTTSVGEGDSKKQISVPMYQHYSAKGEKSANYGVMIGANNWNMWKDGDKNSVSVARTSEAGEWTFDQKYETVSINDANKNVSGELEKRKVVYDRKRQGWFQHFAFNPKGQGISDETISWNAPYGSNDPSYRPEYKIGSRSYTSSESFNGSNPVNWLNSIFPIARDRYQESLVIEEGGS